MDDVTSIEKVLKENNGDPESQPLNGETGEGAKTSQEILDQIKFIGTKITEVSATNKSNSTSNDVMGSIK
jgi:hypothetical protein